MESFSALEREVPSAYAAMCTRLAGREVALDVGGERLAIRFTAQRATFLASAESPAVELRTSRATILDVIDARDSLMTAVVADRMWLRGHPADVVAFHDGLSAYVHGGVRAPTFRTLLAEFRADARRAVA
jgi:hypothetical protein